MPYSEYEKPFGFWNMLPAFLSITVRFCPWALTRGRRPAIRINRAFFIRLPRRIKSLGGRHPRSLAGRSYPGNYGTADVLPADARQLGPTGLTKTSYWSRTSRLRA